MNKNQRVDQFDVYDINKTNQLRLHGYSKIPKTYYVLNSIAVACFLTNYAIWNKFPFPPISIPPSRDNRFKFAPKFRHGCAKSRQRTSSFVYLPRSTHTERERERGDGLHFFFPCNSLHDIWKSFVII